MNKASLCLLSFFIYFNAFSQQENPDSSKNLSEVVVKGYEQNKQLKQSSAAINISAGLNLSALTIRVFYPH